jgi:cell division septation protein DedD
MAGKGTRHRFELSRLEIAGVVLSATAGLFVVFLLGLYAGRGMADRRVDGGEQIVRLPVAPAAEQTPDAEEGLTFYDTLGQAERIAKVEARGRGEHNGAVAPPAEEPALAGLPHERGADAAGNPVESEPPVRSEKAEGVEASSKPEIPVKTEPPAKVSAPSPTAAVGTERAPSPPATARVAVALAPAAVPTPRAPSKGDWSVQVSATRDPRTADGVLRRLRGKGYDAFVLKVRRRGETFYRVRVGHYGSLEEAQQVVSRLRREPGVPEAFVASD